MKNGWKTEGVAGVPKMTPIDDPLSVLHNSREKCRELERGYHRKLYTLLGDAYAISFALDKDFKAWTQLIKDPFWKNRKKKPRRDKDAHKRLLYVLLFMFEAKGKHAYDRVHKYHRGLEFAIKEGTDPQGMTSYIEASGGIEKVYSCALKADPRRTKKPFDESYYDDILQDADSGKESQLFDDEASGDIDCSGEIDSDVSSPRLESNYGALIEAAWKDGREALIADIDDERLQKLLSMKKGRKARITVKRVGKGGGWARFKTTYVKYLK